ncbi:hypothetical protein J132_08113 [Termitomyces sp. J132]|nr:hypothetical protein J132_08113 [Termitomyces sp. J132]
MSTGYAVLPHFSEVEIVVRIHFVIRLIHEKLGNDSFLRVSFFIIADPIVKYASCTSFQSKYETKRSGSLTARISFLGFKFPVFTGIHPGNVLSEEILRGAIEQRTQMLQTRGDFINHSASVEDGNDLLHTNIRPSQNQTIILDQILRQKTLELEDVELNTLCLQREINTLLRKYHEIIQTRKCKMDDVIFYRFMLSPIRLLPPELLVTIFQYAIETCAPLSEAWSPLGLSHVCRAWRNAILGCSKFWVELELNPSNLSQGSRRNHTPSLELFSNMIPAWLGRANGSRRLVLNIFFDDSVQGIHPHDFLRGVGLVAWRLTELLLLFRWREHGKFASPLLTLNTCFFPELEKLTLIEDHYPQEEAAHPILVFGLCSKLRTLTLAACPRRFSEGARLQLPWSQLTCLELVRPISLQSLATVIFHCPQIQTLVIPELDAQSSDPLDFVLPSQRVLFPNLTTLKLNLRSDANPNKRYWRSRHLLKAPSYRSENGRIVCRDGYASLSLPSVYMPREYPQQLDLHSPPSLSACQY